MRRIEDAVALGVLAQRCEDLVAVYDALVLSHGGAVAQPLCQLAPKCKFIWNLNDGCWLDEQTSAAAMVEAAASTVEPSSQQQSLQSLIKVQCHDLLSSSTRYPQTQQRAVFHSTC